MPEPKPVRFRGGGFAPVSIKWIGPVVFILLIGLIELGTQTGLIAALTLPKPSDVLATFGELWRSGQLWQHLAPSLTRLFVGAAAGIISFLILESGILSPFGKGSVLTPATIYFFSFAAGFTDSIVLRGIDAAAGNKEKRDEEEDPGDSESEGSSEEES